MFNNLNSQSLVQWQSCSSLDNAPNLPVIAAVNGKIYVLSGLSGQNIPTFEYDPSTDSWSEKAPIPHGCFWSSGVSVNGKIYVMGGGQPTTKKNYNFVYDPATDSWSAAALLLTPRMYHSATVCNGKIYILGGQNGDGTTEWYFDEYYPDHNTWMRKSQLLNNGAWYCGAASLDNKVYRIAGGGSSNTLIKDNVDRYDIISDSWTELNSFPIRLHAPATFEFKDKIYVIGGYSNNTYIDSICVYDEFSDTWSHPELPRMPQPRSYHKTAMIDNVLYVYGGMNNDENLKGNLIKLHLPVESCVERGSENFDIEISPNPADEHINVKLYGYDGRTTNISIFDLTGNTVFQRIIDLKTDIHKITIDLTNLNTGIYYIQASNGIDNIIKKIIKN
jgi:N-acetylneuraminic acid mutarotase